MCGSITERTFVSKTMLRKNRHVIVLLTLLTSSCGSGLNDSVEITNHAIAPSLVASPTRETSKSFTISKSVSARPDYRSAGFQLLKLDANDTAREYVGVDGGGSIVSFDLGCGAQICQSGTTTTTCVVSLGDDAAGKNRVVSCEGSAAQSAIPAGKYAYQITAQTQSGTFFGGETAKVTGTIEFQ
jgi:hypothetical protein